MTWRTEELLGRFRDEAEERIDAIVDGLLRLERGDAPPEALDGLFREAHSIKGSAGMIALDEVASLAHSMEDTLADARERGALPPERVGPLLRASDELRAAVRRGAPAPQPGAAGERPPGEPGAALEPQPPPAAPSRPRAVDEPQPPPAAPVPGDGRSMRIAAEKVDRLLDTAGEAALHHRRLEHLMRQEADPEATEDELDRGGVLLQDLQESVLELRMLPLGSITAPFARAVRDLAADQDKQVDFRITGDDTQLDRAILAAVGDPLVHILRNAVAHGIEPPHERERAGKPACGSIEMQAEQHGDRVAIRVRDDGRGVAPELVARARAGGSLADVLAEAGMSTAQVVTGLAGRGVGLDAVRGEVEAVGGRIDVRSERGRGTEITLVLPVSLALVEVVLVERAGSVIALPLGDVVEVVAGAGAALLAGRPSLEVRGTTVPAADLLAALGGPADALPQRPEAVVLETSDGPAAILCDRVLGREDLLVKALGPILAEAPAYVGAAVLGDGRVALVTDAGFLVRAAARGVRSRPATGDRPSPRILVADDQFTVRELQRSILEAAGYRVVTARDGNEALERIASSDEIELVVTDVEMPGMGGLELVSRIRADERHAGLPVVVVSARSAPEDERRGMAAGADAYIGKDRFDQEALLETVVRLVGR